MGIENSVNTKDILMYLAVVGGVSTMAYVGYHELRKLVIRYMRRKESIADNSELVEKVIKLEARPFFDDERYDMNSNHLVHGVPIIGEIIKIPEIIKRYLIHLTRHRTPKYLRLYPRQESDMASIKVELVYDEGVKTDHWTKKMSEAVDLPQSLKFLKRRDYVVFQM